MAETTNTKTIELRKTIQSILTTICSDCFYEVAPTSDMFPHIVWTLDRADLGDRWRDDYWLDIDLWDKSTTSVGIDTMTDAVDAALRANNSPQTTILPTFYMSDVKTVIDEDKNIRHRSISVLVQNYEV